MASMDYLENLAFRETRGHLAVMDEMVLREAWEAQERLDPKDLLVSKVVRENLVAVVGNPCCLLT